MPPAPSQVSGITAYTGKEGLHRINPRVGRWREVIYDVVTQRAGQAVRCMDSFPRALIPLGPRLTAAHPASPGDHSQKCSRFRKHSIVKKDHLIEGEHYITRVLDLLTVGCWPTG